MGTYDVGFEAPSRKISKVCYYSSLLCLIPPFVRVQSPVALGGLELHTLSEMEEETGGPAFEETMINSQLSDEPFLTSTLDNSHHTEIDMEDSSPPHHFTNPPQKFVNPPSLSSQLNHALPLTEGTLLAASGVSPSPDPPGLVATTSTDNTSPFIHGGNLNTDFFDVSIISLWLMYTTQTS